MGTVVGWRHRPINRGVAALIEWNATPSPRPSGPNPIKLNSIRINDCHRCRYLCYHSHSSLPVCKFPPIHVHCMTINWAWIRCGGNKSAESVRKSITGIASAGPYPHSTPPTSPSSWPSSSFIICKWAAILALRVYRVSHGLVNGETTATCFTSAAAFRHWSACRLAIDRFPAVTVPLQTSFGTISRIKLRSHGYCSRPIELTMDDKKWAGGWRAGTKKKYQKWIINIKWILEGEKKS